MKKPKMKENEKKQLQKRFIDNANWVLKTHKPKHTAFLDPYQQKIFNNVLYRFPELKSTLWGGYDDSERKIGMIYPHYYTMDGISFPISAVKISGNFNFYRPGHRDVLGALLSLGIKREMLGDILTWENCFFCYMMEEVKDFVELRLTKIGKTSVSVQEIELNQVRVPAKQYKEIFSTVASLRLDSVASSAFGLSRSKTLPYIKGEKVKVNWEVITDPSFEVNPGDILSVTGKGRAKFIKTQGKSRKGRIKIIIHRYI